MGTQRLVGSGAQQQALRPGQGVDINDVYGEFNIGNVTPGEYLRYNVNMRQDDTGGRRTRGVEMEPCI